MAAICEFQLAITLEIIRNVGVLTREDAASTVSLSPHGQSPSVTNRNEPIAIRKFENVTCRVSETIDTFSASNRSNGTNLYPELRDEFPG